MVQKNMAERHLQTKKYNKFHLKVMPDTYRELIMKKIILLFCTLAIVALAVFNLNLIQNREGKVKLEFSNVLSVAKNEGDDGLCRLVHDFYDYGTWTYNDYSCWIGTEIDCAVGWRITEWTPDGWVIVAEQINWLKCT